MDGICQNSAVASKPLRKKFEQAIMTINTDRKTVGFISKSNRKKLREFCNISADIAENWSAQTSHGVLKMKMKRRNDQANS
jgi:hypothetical protein